jgi:cell division septation protein DedD
VRGKDGKVGKDGKDGKAGSLLLKAGLAGAAYARVLVCLMLLPALPVFPVLPVLSQTDPRLIEVIRRAQEGQGDSARAEARRLLASTSPADTLYPQIIYTQAMVANDAGDMRRQLQRVAVEYSSSSWADDALLRLVQLDYASGNLEGASRNLERIRLDYPGSSLLPQAAYWAARTYFDRKNPDLACRWVSEGIGAAQGNVELQNQLGYLNQRCASVNVAAARPPADTQRVLASAGPDTTKSTATRLDSTKAPSPRTDTTPTPKATAPPSPGRPDSGWTELKPATPTPPPTPTPTEPTQVARPAGRFRIQITAVRTAAAAEAIATRLKTRGLTPVTVQEGGLYKVRLGSYATKAEAVAALPEIKAKLGGSPFVVAES